jgi:hypothetical protein
MDRGFANAIAGTTVAHVSGTFYRHAWIGMRDLKASSGGGRWGPPRAYGVLYLGRPEDRRSARFGGEVHCGRSMTMPVQLR